MVRYTVPQACPIGRLVSFFYVFVARHPIVCCFLNVTFSYSTILNVAAFSQHFSYRTPSPGLILREHNKSATLADDISRIYTYSYLTEEPTLGYLRRPIEPYDKAPTSPHFHRPTCKSLDFTCFFDVHESPLQHKIL